MAPLIFILFVAFISNVSKCGGTYGPDPWHNQATDLPENSKDPNVPPDLRIPLQRKELRKESVGSMSEWAYRRILAIIVKGSSVKKDDNQDTVITLSMHFPKQEMDTLDEYLSSNDVFSEDVYRRTIGYVEGAILKPTIGEKIVYAWTDYIQLYLMDYKMPITWGFATIATILTAFYLWNRMSHKHIYFIIFIIIYLYEVFVSYKEAEQQEYDKFMSAVNTCKWYFWSSSCNIPALDPLIFMKHMHPLKIGMRIFSMLVSEPMLVINTAVRTMVEGITDGLWFPFDKILFSVLMVVINITLIIVFIMIMFNFILNIPFKFSFFAGLINIGVQQRQGNFVNPSPSFAPTPVNDADRLSGQNVQRLLEFFSQAMRRDKAIRQEDKRNKPIYLNNQRSNKNKSLKSKNNLLTKSSSTGRLTDLVRSHSIVNEGSWFSFNNNKKISSVKNKNTNKVKDDFKMGSGDNE